MANYWTSRSSRRRFLGTASAGGLGVLGLTAVGCGDDDDDGGSTPSGDTGTPGATPSGGSETPGATQAPQIRRGGNVRFAQTQPLSQTLDPHTGLNQALIYWQFVGNVGIRRDIEGTLQPELITKWEIPGDGSELIFHIRDDVSFHDKAPINGRKMVADDVGYSLMRIAGKAGDAPAGSAFIRASTLPRIASATAVNETTLSVKLSKPHSGFLAGMSEWRNNVIPRDYLEKGGVWNNPAALVGTGPWTTSSYKDNSETVFKANPSYWDKGKPYLDTVTQLFYGDVAASQAAFAQGDLEWLAGGSATINESIKKIAGDSVNEVSWPWTTLDHFHFNVEKKPWDDPRVRRALFLVLDYQNMADSYYGPGKWQYTGPLAVGFPEAIPSAEIQKLSGYDPSTKPAQLQPAKDLLNAAGFPNGKGLDFKLFPFPSPAMQERAVRAQADLVKAFPDAKVNIDVPADVATFSRRLNAGDFELNVYGTSAAPDAVLEMEQSFGTKGSRNVGHFSDPSMDALLEKAATQFDSKERDVTLKSIQEKALELMPKIPAYVYHVTFFHKNELQGFEGFTPLGGGVFDPLWKAQNFWLSS